MNWVTQITFAIKKSHVQETPNLSTDADSSTGIFVFAVFKKGASKKYMPSSDSLYKSYQYHPGGGYVINGATPSTYFSYSTMSI